jgi:hypothetical protein
MYCKRIREGEQNAPDTTWQPMEKYIHDRTASEFSHGICPECFPSVLDGIRSEFT